MQTNTFIGNLARTPIFGGNNECPIVRFTLISNEYAGSSESGAAKERVVSIQFTAFRKLAEIIGFEALTGDQLIVDYRIENNNYEKDGEMVYGYNFIVERFEFGAPGKEKRLKLAERTIDQ